MTCEDSVKGSIKFVQCPPNTDDQTRFYIGARSATRPGTLSNLEYVEKELEIRNLRGNNPLSEFNKDGLHFLEYTNTNTIVPENVEDVEQYLIDVGALIKNFFNANDIICYDYKVPPPSSGDTELSLAVSPKRFRQETETRVSGCHSRPDSLRSPFRRGSHR